MVKERFYRLKFDSRYFDWEHVTVYDSGVEGGELHLKPEGRDALIWPKGAWCMLAGCVDLYTVPGTWHTVCLDCMRKQ